MGGQTPPLHNNSATVETPLMAYLQKEIAEQARNDSKIKCNDGNK